MKRILLPCGAKEKFWSKVDILSKDECWIWNGSADKKRGIPHFSVNISPGENATYLANRVAFFLSKGEPGEMEVCHTCDNPRCVNPAHLFLGTHRENMLDMVKKGRASKGAIHLRFITEEQRMEIVLLSASGKMKYRELAEKYGCSFALINKIIYMYRKERGLLSTQRPK